MTWRELCELGLALPEVKEDIWFRTPALKVRGRSFVRLKEDGKSVVFLLESVEEQEFLTQAQPELFFITDHYRGYPAVLARLARLTRKECRKRLEAGWRLKAPKSLLKSLEVEAAPAKPKTRKRASAPRTSKNRQ